MSWLRRVFPLVSPLFRVWSRHRRGLTLGVRGIVRDGEGRVLLVRHSYVPGWSLPGGGVERGEGVETALVRELAEEGGVRVTGRPRLVSAHDNGVQFAGDHVLVFVVEAWTPCPPSGGAEIVERGWFDPADLPPDATRGTRRRIAEALQGAASDPLW